MRSSVLVLVLSALVVSCHSSSLPPGTAPLPDAAIDAASGPLAPDLAAAAPDLVSAVDLAPSPADLAAVVDLAPAADLAPVDAFTPPPDAGAPDAAIAPNADCARICATTALLHCPNDPGAACVAECEQSLTDTPQCRPQLEVLFRCIDALPISAWECDVDGKASVKQGCDAEALAAFQCILGA